MKLRNNFLILSLLFISVFKSYSFDSQMVFSPDRPPRKKRSFFICAELPEKPARKKLVESLVKIKFNQKAKKLLIEHVSTQIEHRENVEKLAEDILNRENLINIFLSALNNFQVSDEEIQLIIKFSKLSAKLPDKFDILELPKEDAETINDFTEAKIENKLFNIDGFIIQQLTGMFQTKAGIRKSF